MFKKTLDQKFTESKWKKKEVIDLSNRKPKIEKIPTTIGGLKKCRVLNLEENRIDRLPGEERERGEIEKEERIVMKICEVVIREAKN
jgi:hypothetical protein